MKRLTIFMLIILFLASCVSYPFEKDQYLKGTVIGTSIADEFGLVEIEYDHYNYTFMALFSQEEVNKLEDIDRLPLFQEIYFKVKNKNDISYAYDFSISEPMDYKEYLGIPRTTLNYHCFVEHGENRGPGAHRFGHILNKKPIGNNNRRIGHEIQLDNLTLDTFWLSKEHSAFIERVGEGPIFIEYNRINNFATNVDTCHVHPGRKIECRSNRL